MANICCVLFHDTGRVGYVLLSCSEVDRSKMTPIPLNIVAPGPIAQTMAVRHRDSNVQAIIARRDFDPNTMEELAEDMPPNICWVLFHDSGRVGVVNLPCSRVNRSKMTPLKPNALAAGALAQTMAVRHRDSNVEAIIDRKDFDLNTMEDLTEEVA